MNGGAGSADAVLALSTVGVRSCVRTGVLAASLIGGLTFLAVFWCWTGVAPAIEAAVGPASAAGRNALAYVLGPGVALVVALVVALLTATTIVALSAVLPLLYGIAARRTGGVAMVLAPER